MNNDFDCNFMHEFRALCQNVSKISEALHCYHEPKEKPKCWCKNIPGPKYITFTHMMHGDEVKSFVAMNFCPECGRKL